MKIKYFYWGLVLLFIAILAIPKIVWETGETKVSSSNQNQPIFTDALVIEKKEVSDKIFLNASLRGDEEIELRTETPGKVIGINFKEGSRVNKGDLLIKINDADLQAQLQRTESQIKLAEEKESRSIVLLEKALISQEEYDVLLNELNIRKAEKSQIKAHIDKTEIYAPFDGVVGLRSISEGSYINSSISIAILTKTDPIKIDFSVPIKHANKIKVGTTILVNIPNSLEVFKANIYAVDPKIDPSTRTLKVRALADNKTGILLPGSYAEVEIILESDSESFLVPTESIVPDISGELVYIFKNGKAIPTLVKTGLRTNTEVQILDGITEGDTVITSAIIQMHPGADVIIRNFN